MRLQLAIALSLLFVAATARADGESVGWMSVYADDDDLTVVSPRATVQQDLVDGISASVAYEADIISAATVDVRTAASPRGYDEVRHGLLASVQWTPRVETRLSARYLPSIEPDYHSHGFGTTVSHEWYDRRLTTQLSVVVRHNRVGRAGEPSERWRTLNTGIAGLEQGIILDAHTLATITYELQLGRGVTSSPYRYVPIAWPDGTTLLLPEATPPSRTRHAGRAGLRHAFGSRLFVSGGYRLYGDDWGVLSHTADAEVQVDIVRHTLIAAATFRGYHQSAASFYQPIAEAPTGALPRVRSSDKLLAESASLLGELRVEGSLEFYGVIDVLRGMLAVALYDQHFVDFPELDARRALIVSLGVTAEY